MAATPVPAPSLAAPPSTYSNPGSSNPGPTTYPQPLAPRAEPGEPLSNTEAFFAARLPDQQPPLRQFGYDTF
ncbi:hypothetical protein [Roseomonas sp. WA12]